ncbi:MAG: phosphoribosylpyrophosphate synthetase [Flavobacteriaceae bacterium]
MKNAYTSLSKAIAALQKIGYTEDFNLYDQGMESGSLEKQWEAAQLKVIKYYRFEGMSSPEDNSILYVIETSDGKKGLLVDNYSASESNLSPEMLQKLKIDHQLL